jgi:hypothetical protein
MKKKNCEFDDWNIVNWDIRIRENEMKNHELALGAL